MPVDIRGHIVAAAHGVLQPKSGQSPADQQEPEVEAGPSRRGAHRYNAFISYHRETDGNVAPAFQSALHRFAKPWYRLRAVRVFLDDASMSSGPLRSAIERALDDAEFFVLLASPEAADSRWVKREVAYWRKQKPRGRLLLVLTTGEELVWDEKHGDFDWARNPPLPRTIRGGFDEEPRWSDLRKAKEQGDLSLRNPDFRRAVADVAASLHHGDREEIEGEDVRQHRRTVRLARGVAAALATLTVVSILAAVYAIGQRNEARAERDLATSRYLAAQAVSDLDTELPRSLLLSVEALRFEETAEARSALLTGLQYRSPQLSAVLQGQRDPSLSVAFSPSEGILASGSDDGKIMLWDVRQRRQLGKPLTGHSGLVRSVAFSPGRGLILASGDGDGTIMLWDVQQRRRIARVTGLQGGVISLAFSPSGNTLASGGNDGSIFIWDTNLRPQLDEPLSDPGGLATMSPVSALAFSPNSDTLAAGYEDGTVSLWDAGGYVVAGPLAGHDGHVLGLAFGPRGETIASGGSDGRVLFWNVEDQRRLGKVIKGARGEVQSLAFSPDGRKVAFGGADGTIVTWDVETRRRLETLTGHTTFIFDLAFGPLEDNLLVSGAGDGVILWDLDRRIRMGTSLGGHDDLVSSLAMSPDGRTLASGGSDETVVLWDVKTRRQLVKLIGHESEVNDVAFSPDEGNVLASGDGDGKIILWDVAGRPRAREELTGHDEPVESVVFGLDENRLVSGDAEGSIIFWDLERRPPTKALSTKHSDAVWSLAVNSDRDLLASGGGDGRVVVWDVERQQPFGSPLSTHAESVASVALDPAKSMLASANLDGAITIWDAEQRDQIGEPLTWPKGLVKTLAFSPTDDILASGGDPRTVILWDVQTHQQIGSLTGHRDQVEALAFTPGGEILASGGFDETIILWDLSLSSWKARACAIANRNLSQAEWDQFVGGPYERTCPNLPAGEGAPANS